jgi:hypothetical protein
MAVRASDVGAGVGRLNTEAGDARDAERADDSRLDFAVQGMLAGWFDANRRHVTAHQSQ